jgi:hypothetical protein
MIFLYFPNIALAILIKWIAISVFIATTGIAFGDLLKSSIPTEQYQYFLLDLLRGPQLSMHNICLRAVVSIGVILLPIFVVTIFYRM